MERNATNADPAKYLGDADDVSTWDRFGIGMSALCAVHCLLMPVLLAALPLWPVLAAVRGWLHPLFIVLLAPVAYRAARSGARRRARIPVLLGLGIVAIAVAWWGHDVWGHAGETAMTLAGSALLIAGHWANHRCTHRASLS